LPPNPPATMDPSPPISLFPAFVVADLQVRASLILFSADTSSPLSPLESALAKNMPVNLVESALPKHSLKSFRIRTYEKTPGGPCGGPCRYFVRSAAVLPCKGRQQIIQPSFRGGGDNGPGAKSLVHCLAHGGSHLEHIRHPQPSGRACSVFPKFSVSLTNHKKESEQTCSRD